MLLSECRSTGIAVLFEDYSTDYSFSESFGRGVPVLTTCEVAVKDVHEQIEQH